jgi:hypothetical protein
MSALIVRHSTFLEETVMASEPSVPPGKRRRRLGMAAIAACIVAGISILVVQAVDHIRESSDRAQ